MVRVMPSQIGKIITKSLVITNRLSFTMAALIIDYYFSSDLPALKVVSYLQDENEERLHSTQDMVNNVFSKQAASFIGIKHT